MNISQRKKHYNGSMFKSYEIFFIQKMFKKSPFKLNNQFHCSTSVDPFRKAMLSSVSELIRSPSKE